MASTDKKTSSSPIPVSFTEIIKYHFDPLEDPRRKTANMFYDFMSIVTIAICGVISGADSWVAVEEYGKDKEEWFKGFLPLPNGVPFHDVFTNVFQKLDPCVFEKCFTSLTAIIVQLTNGEVIAVDGKTNKRIHDRKFGRSPIHMVSAFATGNMMVLGQVRTHEKSNEITAIPLLLESLYIRGSVITIDTMGCQRTIATLIIEKEADYILALKGNQGNLSKEVSRHFEEVSMDEEKERELPFAETIDRGHGRKEVRRCWVESDLSFISKVERWDGLSSVIKIQSERTLNGETSIENRYYISSLDSSEATAKEYLQKIQSQWHIENKLHWSLDMAFREDECRIRVENGAENFAILRHLALNLLKNETSAKVGIKIKRQKAGRNNAYLLIVLDGLTPRDTADCDDKSDLKTLG